MSDYILCARKISDDGKTFTSDASETSTYLKVDDGQPWTPNSQMDPKEWVRAIIAEAVPDNEGAKDVLIFVHGYNNSQDEVRTRHDLIKNGLAGRPNKFVMVSFDWPSGTSALAYLNDRSKADHTALQLMKDGIRLLSAAQMPDCPINVHLLAHSTGAYVVREAFDNADDAAMPNAGWMVSQIAYISGDVSAGSMGDDQKSN